MQLLRKFAVRTAVAAVGLALLALIGYVGGWLFWFTVAALTVVALSEYYSALQTKGIRPNVHLGWLCSLLMLFITQQGQDIRQMASPPGGSVPGAGLESTASVLQVMMLVLFLCSAGTLVAQFKMRPGQSAVVNSATTVFGVVYVGVLMSFLLRMRYVDIPALTHYDLARGFTHRMGGLIFAVAPVWLCDAAAYFAGTLWGRRKLAPAISPNKTVEGSVAGLVAAVLGAVLLGAWLHIPTLHCLLLGLVMGVLGQLGDLGKSVLKRDLGVKDFGSLFGPHGGVIDRFDAILFNMPLVYWYFWYFWMARV